MAALFVFLCALAVDPTYAGGWPALLLQPASLFVAERIARIDLSNPLTALIATALSWSGLTISTLSWFAFMPLFGILFAKLGKAATT